jgi:hypothetical protein
VVPTSIIKTEKLTQWPALKLLECSNRDLTHRYLERARKQIYEDGEAYKLRAECRRRRAREKREKEERWLRERREYLEWKEKKIAEQKSWVGKAKVFFLY